MHGVVTITYCSTFICLYHAYYDFDQYRTTSYDSPFVSTFTYSGSILYLEHLVLTITLNVTDFTQSINTTAGQQILDEYLNDYYVSEFDFETYIKRGDFEVTIRSPSNTASTLLFKRPFDIVNTESYYQWPFLTVLHWGEDPRGQWTVTVNWTNANGGSGIIDDVSATIYGVSQVPESVANIPEKCNSLCARSKGCSGPGPSDCDVCNNSTLRYASSLECIQASNCVESRDGYCYDPVPQSGAGFFTGEILLLTLCFFVIMYVY